MPQSLPRWLRILIVAGPLGGCGVVAPGGCGSLAHANPPAEARDPHVAATVNGEAIPLARVDAVVRRLPTGKAGPLTAAQVRRLRAEVVQDLIDDLLLAQFLRKNTPSVEPAELDRHLKALQEALRRQGKTLADYLRESGLTEVEVRDLWATTIRFNKYMDARATEAELRKYHEANREFFDNVQVRASHIVVRVAAGSPPGERTAARQKLAAVRADILAGKLSFAEAARKYSMCPTAPMGGDLGFLTRKDAVVDEAISRTAFALKPGEVSDPTDSDSGVHLVQATERKAGTPVPFEKVVELVRDSFAEDVRGRLVVELRKQAVIHVTVPE
jgi:peptidyl-prolyl cis-trans isomerase C